MIGKYTPAETLMILESDKTTLKMLLLLTFLDLRLKKVIDLIWANKPTKDGDSWCAFVQYDENFIEYEPKPHERVYYDPMASSSKPQNELSQLIRQAHEMAHDPEDYLVNYFLEDRGFAKNFTAVIGGGYPLSSAGKKTNKLLSEEIHLLNTWTPYYMDTSPQEVAEILLSIGGNIFLLNTVPHEKLETFGHLIGRDRILRYKNDKWFFEEPKPKEVTNPFYHLSQISKAFYKEYARI